MYLYKYKYLSTFKLSLYYYRLYSILFISFFSFFFQVPRQITLPTVPQRHESFQRELNSSPIGHLNSVPFSVYSRKQANEIVIIKVSIYRKLKKKVQN